MIQVSDLSTYRSGPGQRTAITIGNFDGCHLGHQELIAATKQYANQLGAKPLAVTFAPRPEAFFHGLFDEALLCTAEQKTRCFDECGLALQVIQRFDANFSRISHIEFYRCYLLEQLAARALVVGDNFRFGYQRLGDTAYLRQCSIADRLSLTISPALQQGGHSISSTRIRAMLQEHGDVSNAAMMLGRPYMLEGCIAKGEQLGRRLGFPTANLGEVQQLLPKSGVYAGFVWLQDETGSIQKPAMTTLPANVYPAVFNIGIRPTLHQASPPVRVEAHLLAGTFGTDALYGLRAGFYLAHRLRDETKFADTEELRQQIARDCKQAGRLLGLTV